MKQLLPKFWAKFVAGLLFVVMTVVLVVSAAGVFICAVSNAYLDGGTQLREAVLRTMAANKSWDAQMYYEISERMRLDGSDGATGLEEEFSPERTNYFFKITDGDGNELLNSYTDEYQYCASSSFSVELESSEKDIVSRDYYTNAERETDLEELRAAYHVTTVKETERIDPDGQTVYHLYLEYFECVEGTFILTSYIRSDLTKVRDDISYAVQSAGRLVELRSVLIATGAVSLVLAIVLLVFLLSSAGHKEGEEEIHLTWFDRIPLDLLLVILVFLAVITVRLIDAFSEAVGALLVLAAAATAIWAVLLLLLLMSTAARIKAGTTWKNNVLYRLLVQLKKFLLWLWRGIGYLVRSLPLYWKAGVFWAALSLFELIFIVSGGFAEFWFIEKLVLTAALILIVISMRRLQEGAKRIAAGEVDYTIDLTHMIGDFKAHGEDLNRIRDGLQAAVDERVKSERMKAELITNVSHDIKTPLTSIVNYVDLLKKEELGSDTAREYVAVLERQAQRLKKLTEDVVEASKASTGSIPVHLERTDLNVLLSQAAGEYADRFAEQRLELRTASAQEQTYVTADGRLLWRVFSNLMSNVGKYALEGTRVYLSTEVQHGRAVVSLKNISRYPLNVSGEELVERFVRGDKSRASEGSGLGLSIARSLTELQGGVFDIVVDGDLFKVTLSFPLA